ncbi:MAG: alpha/beta hydrolase [Pseudomonadota bacterium]
MNLVLQLRAWCFGALVALLAACGPLPPLIGIDNPAVPARSVAGVSLHKVFIATTREDSEVVGALFSELRADELGLASVTVSIPPNHEIGRLERPRSLPPDPRTEFAVVDPTIYTQDRAFLDALNRELAQRSPDQRDVLFFVHGYNTTASTAILRAAQFVEDTGFQGVPVLFTWASAGRISEYVYDMNSALIARPKLLQAGDLVSQSIAKGYFVFAHSMGGFLTMEGLVDAVQEGELDFNDGSLEGIVLASPDIDLDLFRSQIQQLEPLKDDIYVLLSEEDYALNVSRWIAGGVPRVGAANADEIARLGVNAIDLTAIKDSRTDSHNKFVGSPAIVQLIGNGLNDAPDYGGREALLQELVGNLPIRVVPAGG